MVFSGSFSLTCVTNSSTAPWFSGYRFEELAAGSVGDHSRKLLEGIDVLVDGPFVLSKKDLGLRFRGSSNQRIIQVSPSLETGEIHLAGEYM